MARGRYRYVCLAITLVEVVFDRVPEDWADIYDAAWEKYGRMERAGRLTVSMECLAGNGTPEPGTQKIMDKYMDGDSRG